MTVRAKIHADIIEPFKKFVHGLSTEQLLAFKDLCPYLVLQEANTAKGVSPTSVSNEPAPMDTPWAAPTLSDFTNDAWGDVPTDEKRLIAQHYAWAAQLPPDAFGNLKLPHHRASDGYVIWRGVANAAARLPQASIPNSDMAAVRAHLGRHYRLWNRTPPWEANADVWVEYERVVRDLIADPLSMPLAETYQRLFALLFSDGPVQDHVLTLDEIPVPKEDDADILTLALDDIDAEDINFDRIDGGQVIQEVLLAQLKNAVTTGIQQALVPLTGRLPD